MSVRVVRTRIAFGLILLCIAGCAQLKPQQHVRAVPVFKAADAPKYALALPTEPTISTVSSHVEPKFLLQDERPETEKVYYPGETDPHHWRDAVTVLPMEGFEPDLEKLLRKRVLKSLINSADYDYVTLKMNSFYVALDERERARIELISDFGKWETEQAQIQEEKRQRRVLDSEDDSFGDRVGKLLFTAAVVSPAEAKKYRFDRAEQLIDYPQSLPRNLTATIESGWNCNIEAELILKSMERGEHSIPLAARSQHAKEDSRTVTQQIQDVVNAAVSDLQRQITAASNVSVPVRGPGSRSY